MHVKRVQYLPCILTYYILCVYSMMTRAVLFLSIFSLKCKTDASHTDFASVLSMCDFVLPVCLDHCLCCRQCTQLEFCRIVSRRMTTYDHLSNVGKDLRVTPKHCVKPTLFPLKSNFLLLLFLKIRVTDV